MASISDYAENLYVNATFGNTTFTRPATFYIAMYTAAPSDSGGGTEVVGGAYARQAVVTGASSRWAAAVGGLTENLDLITFPTPTANWGTLTHSALFDALTGGNMWFHSAMATPVVVNTGTVFRFGIGEYEIAFQ